MEVVAVEIPGHDTVSSNPDDFVCRKCPPEFRIFQGFCIEGKKRFLEVSCGERIREKPDPPLPGEELFRECRSKQLKRVFRDLLLKGGFLIDFLRTVHHRFDGFSVELLIPICKDFQERLHFQKE